MEVQIGPFFGAWLVDLVFGLLIDLMEELANLALAAILVFFIFYLIYLIVRRYTYDRDRMRWGDVVFEVGLLTGVIALFMMPAKTLNIPPQVQITVSQFSDGGLKFTLNVTTGTILNYQSKMPMVMWLPYAAAKTSWEMGDYISNKFFNVPMAAIPVVFRDHIEYLSNQAGELASSMVGDVAARASEYGSSGEAPWYQSILQKIQPYLATVVNTAMGAVGGGAAAAPVAPIAGPWWWVIVAAGAALGGAAGFFKQGLIEMFILAGAFIAFYGALADLLVRSLMFIFMLPVAVVSYVAQPRRGRDSLARQVARGFAIAIEGVGIVFIARVFVVIFAVMSKVIIPFVSNMAFSGGSFMIAVLASFIVPVIMLYPLLRLFRGIEHYIADALNTTNFFSPGFAAMATQRAGSGGGLIG
ncbi:MAG: hypothetical protein QXO76_03915 [Thermoproteota archaeon]